MKHRPSHAQMSRLILGATALALLAACASPAAPNATLEQARTRLAAVQRQPRTEALAADELDRARSLLRRAEQARLDGDDSGQITHLAYLSLQQTTIAEEVAIGREAQAFVAGAATARDRQRLAMRTREADEARTQQSAAEADSRAERERVARRDHTVSELESQLRDMNARNTDRGMVITLGDLLFDTGDARLRPTGQHRLDQLATFLRRTPQQHAAIDGYTDNVGTAVANQTLSDRRAHAVMSALIGLGVPANQLSTQGFGEANPVAPNNSAAGRQMNRRVEVVLAQEKPQQGEHDRGVSPR